MEYRNLVVESGDGLATITLNRPDQMNPLDRTTVGELLAAFAAIEADPALRVVLLTGAGRAFSAGGDLTGYLELYRQPEAFRGFLDDLNRLCRGFEQSSRVVVAVVNGWCVAGGLELMLSCDLAIAGASARISDGHLNFGQLPGAGGSQRLPRAIGAQRARHMIYSARAISAAEAERIGLVAQVLPDAELMDGARAFARDLLAKSRVGLAGAKRLISHGLTLPLDQALRFEMDVVHDYATTCPDSMEGLMAFNEKRKPRFA